MFRKKGKGSEVTACYGETKKTGDFEFKKPSACATQYYSKKLSDAQYEREYAKLQRLVKKMVKRS